MEPKVNYINLTAVGYKNPKQSLDNYYDSYTEKMLHFKGNRYEYNREDIQFNMHSKTWGYTQRCEMTSYVDVTNATSI